MKSVIHCAKLSWYEYMDLLVITIKGVSALREKSKRLMLRPIIEMA